MAGGQLESTKVAVNVAEFKSTTKCFSSGVNLSGSAVKLDILKKQCQEIFCNIQQLQTNVKF
jgi:hypothetical protein